MKEADGVILASPVYFGSATALIKALIERTGTFLAKTVNLSVVR
jgi:multimeric flavodoxin WrbA